MVGRAPPSLNTAVVRSGAVAELTIGEAAAQTGWSPRMLRYLEDAGLVVPRRSGAGYRLYGLLELNQLRSLRELRRRHDVELTDVAFAARLEREPELRAAVITWLAGTPLSALDWEQRKHERLLAA
jgi:MerR family transcriptional regulator, copper efflux regulator